MRLRPIIVTGASGFVGRRLLHTLKETHRIYGIARRSQSRSGAPVHPNIRWFQVDIGDRASLEKVFHSIEAEGGAEILVHLAAHYDFTGEEHPEYWRTNVEGLTNVLDLCVRIGVGRAIFSSSLAACSFPAPGQALTEKSPPDGTHIYARSKAQGESALDLYQPDLSSVIVRFAALFSDWCEYPPLFMFLQTWLSTTWNRRMLAGRGRSAIPYMHVRDVVRFLSILLDRLHEFEHGEVLIASGDGATSHEELYLASTFYHQHEPQPPIHVPRLLVRPGIHLRCTLGRLSGSMPFERPWMADYIDESLTVDSSYTRRRLDWEPRARLEILRRLPFLLENLKADPAEWNRRNREAMKSVHMRPFLRIHALLDRHANEITEAFTEALTREEARETFPSYQDVDQADHAWNHRLILRSLMNAVRTRERAVFLAYCHDLAERRFEQGYSGDELRAALNTLHDVCLDVLGNDPDVEPLRPYLHEHITTTMRFAIDEIDETFDVLNEEARLREQASRRTAGEGAPPPA